MSERSWEDDTAADESIDRTDTVGNTVNSAANSTPSYDHVLEIRAADGADLMEYAIEVTGEAVVGSSSNVQESVTQLSNGNYLLEGQIADGGTDDFEFNGEVVTDGSSIDGNATAYVDGSEIDLSSSGSGGSQSYEHVLEVTAASNADLTTYAVTVTGEAIVGEKSNPQESVTQTDSGDYLLEGQVATGGTDDFEFNGDVLTAESSISGDATAYVDGTEIDLSADGTNTDSGFADYTTPDPGTTDWHEPLNNNFDSLRQDVQTLNERLTELEKQLN